MSQEEDAPMPCGHCGEESAVVKCSRCSKVLCLDCDKLLHSVGQAKQHQRNSLDDNNLDDDSISEELKKRIKDNNRKGSKKYCEVESCQKKATFMCNQCSVGEEKSKFFCASHYRTHRATEFHKDHIEVSKLISHSTYLSRWVDRSYRQRELLEKLQSSKELAALKGAWNRKESIFPTLTEKKLKKVTARKKGPKRVIAITGHNDAGKSTLTNALLGKKLLYVASGQATSRITKILYNGNLHEDFVMYRVVGKVEVMETVKIENLPQKLFHDPSADQKEFSKSHLELYLNHPLLKSGIMIIDFPGFLHTKGCQVMNDTVTSYLKDTEPLLLFAFRETTMSGDLEKSLNFLNLTAFSNSTTFFVRTHFDDSFPTAEKETEEILRIYNCLRESVVTLPEETKDTIRNSSHFCCLSAKRAFESTQSERSVPYLLFERFIGNLINFFHRTVDTQIDRCIYLLENSLLNLVRDRANEEINKGIYAIDNFVQATENHIQTFEREASRQLRDRMKESQERIILEANKFEPIPSEGKEENTFLFICRISNLINQELTPILEEAIHKLEFDILQEFKGSLSNSIPDDLFHYTLSIIQGCETFSNYEKRNFPWYVQIWRWIKMTLGANWKSSEAQSFVESFKPQIVVTELSKKFKESTRDLKEDMKEFFSHKDVDLQWKQQNISSVADVFLLIQKIKSLDFVEPKDKIEIRGQKILKGKWGERDVVMKKTKPFEITIHQIMCGHPNILPVLSVGTVLQKGTLEMFSSGEGKKEEQRDQPYSKPEKLEKEETVIDDTPFELPCLIFPFISSTLKDVLVPKKRIQIKRKIDFCLGITAALKFMHQTAYTHRDLTPENILVNENDQIFLADFGNAHLATRINVTQDPGTRLFSAPEATSTRYDNNTIDVFSFGLIMWCIYDESVNPWASYGIEFTGKETAKEEQELLEKHEFLLLTNKKPIQLPSNHLVDMYYSKIVDQCLEYEQKKRIKIASVNDKLNRLSALESLRNAQLLEKLNSYSLIRIRTFFREISPFSSEPRTLDFLPKDIVPSETNFLSFLAENVGESPGEVREKLYQEIRDGTLFKGHYRDLTDFSVLELSSGNDNFKANQFVWFVAAAKVYEVKILLFSSQPELNVQIDPPSPKSFNDVFLFAMNAPHKLCSLARKIDITPQPQFDQRHFFVFNQ